MSMPHVCACHCSVKQQYEDVGGVQQQLYGGVRNGMPVGPTAVYLGDAVLKQAG